MLIGYFGGAFTSIPEMMLKSFSFGSLIGIIIIHYYFKSLGLWIFYDNLKINKYIQMVLSFVSYLSLTVLLLLIINAIKIGL